MNGDGAREDHSGAPGPRLDVTAPERSAAEPETAGLEDAVRRLEAQYRADFQEFSEALRRQIASERRTVDEQPTVEHVPRGIGAVPPADPPTGPVPNHVRTRQRVPARLALGLALLTLALFGLIYLLVVGHIPLRVTAALRQQSVPTRTTPPTPTSAALGAAVTPELSPSPTAAPEATLTSVAAGGPVTTPTPAPSATPGPVTAAMLAERAAAAEAALRSGELDATAAYGDGSRSSVLVIFDLGAPGSVARLYTKTTYVSPKGTQTVERITVGERSWQLQPDGSWVAAQEQEGVWGRVQPFLPHASSAAYPTTTSDGQGPTTISWEDSGNGTMSTLEVDTATGTPRVLRRETPSSGTQLTITYRGWNTPVSVEPPAGS